MRKLLFIFGILGILFADKTLAIGYDSEVSASVTSESLYAPNLISPPNNHASSSSLFTFVWRRPSPLPSTTLDHYDLFIDDAIFAASVPDSLTQQDFYFYTATGSSGLFYIGLKQSLSEGYHNWKVSVYDNIGRNTTTGKWIFYIDTIDPFISLTKVDETEFAWNSAVVDSIPDESERHLLVDSDSPILGGYVEENANLLISLSCPSGAPAECLNQSWIINSTDGSWEKQFEGLVQNIDYLVNLSSTDAVGNSTVFPTFYIKYATDDGYFVDDEEYEVTPTDDYYPVEPDGDGESEPVFSPELEVITPTLSQSTLSGVLQTLTPPPGLSALITPTPFRAVLPPKPTLPPVKADDDVKSFFDYGYLAVIILLCLGLPVHLAVCAIGLGIPFKNIIRFFYTLGYPFLRFKSAKTRPFCLVELKEVTGSNRVVFRSISDICGELYFPKKLPLKVSVEMTSSQYWWNEKVLPGSLLAVVCLLPYAKKRLSSWEKLQSFLYSVRVVPLVLAILSSTVCLFFYRNWYLMFYLYLSCQFAFSEYLYPIINKNKIVGS